jgi:hypothetical protein
LIGHRFSAYPGAEKIAKGGQSMPQKRLLVTTTGEYMQPARVYYDLFNKQRLKKIFSNMPFMQFDPKYDRWTWLYTGKAKKLKFQVRYADIPRSARRIVLGSFLNNKEDEMFLEVRSFERATKGISFFDQKIPRSVAKVTDIVIVNRLLDESEKEITTQHPVLEHLFPADKEELENPGEKFLELMRGKKPQNEQDRQALQVKVFQLMEKERHEPVPKVERLPTNYYEEGIESLESLLRIRQGWASRRWQGDENLTMNDFIHELVSTPKLFEKQ